MRRTEGVSMAGWKWLFCLLLPVLCLAGSAHAAQELATNNSNIALYALDGGWAWAYNSDKTSHAIVPQWRVCCQNCNCDVGQICGVEVLQIKFRIKYKSVHAHQPLYTWGAVHTDGPFPPVCQVCCDPQTNTHNDTTSVARKPVAVEILAVNARCICCNGTVIIVKAGYVDEWSPLDGPKLPLKVGGGDAEDGDVGVEDWGSML